MTTPSTYEGVPCLRLKTAERATEAEEVLRGQGKSYKTRIVKTKKHGLEYVVQVFG